MNEQLSTIPDYQAAIYRTAAYRATSHSDCPESRHHAGSNQIAALNEVCEPILSTDFLATWVVGKTLAAKLRDPEFRSELAQRSARTDENRPLIGKIYLLGNTYENMGILVNAGVVDKGLVLKMVGVQCGS
jgi:hypothetical protein